MAGARIVTAQERKELSVKAVGLTLPPSLLAWADEVLE